MPYTSVVIGYVRVEARALGFNVIESGRRKDLRVADVESLARALPRLIHCRTQIQTDRVVDSDALDEQA